MGWTSRAIVAAALSLAGTVLGATWQAPVTSAAAPRVIEAPGCCGTTSTASYGGWAAWSRLDPASGEYELVVRSPDGSVTTPPLPRRAQPFDVQIGPTASGPAAVYSRCSDASTLQGCSLRELPLAAPTAERTLSPPISGSLHEPAIWEGQLTFLRRRGSGGEDPEHPGARPDDLYTWRIGSRHADQQRLPASKGSHAEVSWPRGLTGVISGLTIDTGWIGYVTATAASGSPFALSTLWAQRPGQSPRLIDQVTGAAGNVCPPQFLSPSISADTLTAYLHACSPSGSNLDRWTRYSLTHRAAEQATYRFTTAPDEAIYSLLPYGSGAIWSSEGGILTASPVKWKPIPRPAPESFCSHDDLIC